MFASMAARARYGTKLAGQHLALLQGRGELCRLLNDHPQLAGLEERLPVLRGELAAQRSEYVRTVSKDSMALSLESAALLAALLERLDGPRVIDLGSGFSSLVVRSANNAECWSIDDSAQWLNRTVELLEERNLPTEKCMTWPDFLALPGQPFDLVVHDLGSTHSLRRSALPRILESVAPQGWILIDDVHVSGYRAALRSSLRKESFSTYRLSNETMDWHGRYSWLACRTAM